MTAVHLYVSRKSAQDNNLIQLAEIHRLLDRRRQTVHMWMKRRHTSHFPMPKGLLRYGSKWIDLYDKTEVIEWHKTYVPARGGAPIGNRNWVPKSQKTTS